MENNIELELRAEVSLDQLDILLSNLGKNQKTISHTRRLSVMFLGVINQINFDIRIRTNSDGETELVIKKGDYHAHDRIEFSKKVSRDQFIDMVKIFSMFEFEAKITERENIVFDLGNETTIVLVKAGNIAYVEIEKMSHEDNIHKNKAELLNIISSLNLKLIDSGEQFNELCNRLTRDCDKVFDGTIDQIKELETIIKTY